MASNEPYIIHPRSKRNPFACWNNPFLDPNSHLSLGEIERRETLARYRQKCAKCGAKLPPAEAGAWAALNRVPRRPPIYRTEDTPPPGAA